MIEVSGQNSEEGRSVMWRDDSRGVGRLIGKTLAKTLAFVQGSGLESRSTPPPSGRLGSGMVFRMADYSLKCRVLAMHP